MTKLKKILIPTDLSEYARYALPYAVELARTNGAEIHLVHVLDTTWLAPAAAAEFPGQLSVAIDNSEELAAETLREMGADIKEVPVHTKTLVGAPHVEIVRYARQQETDLVVVSTHGRTGLSHALIGSVAEKIVQMAPCPVLTVKHPEHEFVMP
ncbi:MAG: universal stress protein [Candidatus Latescibacteria bacterium]|jgi:nucleotide-binding universal stress UspA family protein|nr:universal stress protein [Candidatus Latescibacterota bacterium]